MLRSFFPKPDYGAECEFVPVEKIAAWKKRLNWLNTPLCTVDGHAKALSEGKHVHFLIMECGLERKPSFCDLLIRMYGKCGAVDDALKCFVDMTERNIRLWNFIIRVHLQHQHSRKALQLFQQMHMDSAIPDKGTFVNILSTCASMEDLQQGKRLHAQLKCLDLESDVVVGTVLVSMYSKCSSLEDARSMFDRMPNRNVVSWNAIIAAYAQRDYAKEALRLSCQMQHEGLIPNKATFVSIVSAFACQGAIANSRWIHAQVAHLGFDSDVVLATALIYMYGKCGNLDSARKIFDEMPEQYVVSWTAMITVYTQHGHGVEALQLFDQMQQQGVIPNQITYISSLQACDSQGSLRAGKWKHVQIMHSSFELDVVMSTALAHMYGKCSSMEDACKMFNMTVEKNVVSWNTMISAHTKHGQGNQAIQLFIQMQHKGITPDEFTFVSILHACKNNSALSEGKLVHYYILQSRFESDVVVCNALIDLYGKCNSLDDARNVFDRMPGRDVISWNAIIHVYVQTGYGKKAIDLFNQMQVDKVIPDSITHCSMLSAFDTTATLLDGKAIHSSIVNKSLDSEIVVATALINMYGKCDCLEDARKIFDKMPERDLAAWNTIIAAYVQHGHGKEALQLFDKMQSEGLSPDNITLVSCIYACSCNSVLAKGKQIHTCILHTDLKSDGVMIGLLNMYAKCGSLEGARILFDKLCERDVMSWNFMIAAYAQYGNGREAILLFEQMQKAGIIPDEVTFVCLFCACSHAGLVEEGHQYLGSMDSDHGVMPTVEHYDCIIDLLGRAGQLNEAEHLMENMPFKPTSVSWTTLLGACRNLADAKRGQCAAKHMLEIDPKNFSPYITLLSIYSACGMEKDAEKLTSTNSSA